MSILVIHPKDPTTDFLQEIYNDLNCTVLRNEVSNNELIKNILNHERTIMLGHGLPYGLLGWGKLVINYSFQELLKSQINNVYIWCHANKFVRAYNLKGMASGMIISEVPEAEMYEINVSQQEIDESNKLFALSVKKAISSSLNPLIISEQIKEHYKLDNNPVVNFNNQNIFYYE